MFYRILWTAKSMSRRGPHLPSKKKKEEERKKRDKNSRDIRIPKDATSKILPYDIMNLFINGVPRGLDRQNNNCTHVQHTFFNIYLPTTTTTRRCLILRFMEDNIEQLQTGVRLHLTRSVSWNSRHKDWKNANLLFKRNVSCFAVLGF